MSDFTRLRVWQRARWLADALERETERLDPVVHPGMRDELCRRASDIVRHIERGTREPTPAAFAQSLLHAVTVAVDVQRLLQRATERGALDGPRSVMLQFEVVDIRRMLGALRQKIIERVNQRA